MGPARFQLREVGVVVKQGALRVAALAAGAVLTVGALAGCSGQPGVAASVNGHTITTAELSTTISDLDVLQAGAQPTAVLNALVLEPLEVEVAKKHDIVVSDSDVHALLAKAYAGKGKVPSSTGIMAVARAQLVQDKLSSASDVQQISDELTAAVKDAKLTVNPRFGSIDPKTKSISEMIAAPTTPAWLVATPTPAPTAA